MKGEASKQTVVKKEFRLEGRSVQDMRWVFRIGILREVEGDESCL